MKIIKRVHKLDCGTRRDTLLATSFELADFVKEFVRRQREGGGSSLLISAPVTDSNVSKVRLNVSNVR